MRTSGLFFCLSTLLCLSAFADTNPANPNRLDYLDAAISDLQNQVADLKAITGKNAINKPAGPQINEGCDFFVTGDLLYWKATETGLEYAIKAKVRDPATLTLGNGSLAKPHFDWDLGFRVGLGWNTNHDNWDLFFSWTRIHTAAHGHRHARNANLIALDADNYYGDVPSLSASTSLTIHLNVLNFELGREFYVGKSLSVRPHFGFENTWISQHRHAKYQGHPAFLSLPASPDSFDRIKYRNNFWGIGARAGVDMQWDLRWGISVVGNAAGSLLYGRFNLKRTSHFQEVVTLPFENKAHLDEHLTAASSVVDLLLGMQWDYMFAHDQYHIGLRLAWEEHMYFEQNQMFNVFANELGASRVVAPDTSLFFQGLTASIRLDF